MNNGIGPSWFPDRLRKALTKFGSTFFDEASWSKHDEGYTRGAPPRAECDYKFLQAMLRDVSKLPSVWRMFLTVYLAFTFWLACRLFGWMTYNKR